MSFLTRRRWSPYVVGSLIGVLSWFAFVTADRPLGVSTALAKTAGMAEHVVVPAHVESNAYFQKFVPAVDWEWMLVAGIFLGAFASARLSGDNAVETVPTLWRRRFGASPAKRYLAAFAGGVILALGARLASGCTSGNGISGSLQLAVSGWVFFGSLFLSGLATAFLIYGKDASLD
ncbi:YeeE/YedE thiosulfate transporter family protein [uncultured Paludibaculum sp.]|uniref:YeeE/YedE thiosulfate transporter family protein n=1 Tax=uncultured Paludibaculum sp. TaxID=1765020 RepID=UPI002AABB632|nr:YeeE/YedE thiosulfate transporter family protein [uncultured Paludibaculum sp.]